jgi:long-chain acyl-CoA synthetase
VLNHSGIQSIFCSGAACETLFKTTNIGKLKTLVSFDELAPQLVQGFQNRGVTCLIFGNIIQHGKLRPYEYANVKPEQCLTFSYTSGTTGPPKAAMLSHKNFCSCCSVLSTHPDAKFYSTDIYLSYLPLPHLLERIFVYGMLSAGAEIW